ncbi:lytic transglycosylase domain-containing protein [Streptomyces sp. WMMC940]|uniref:lytic transglycosylase domain-containing protein n=1 Tax=Streptomyces sp. WMMC940 TaxID=3015153 RepID=UPI0022B749D8|nr:lytic transglycosylase domain-containing protein [Streptomyces sp. WMMC940]MCZ7460985.1 lytic transglycosylase domain-containing protein [Streptomyces sp. WMMC940]
MAAQFGRRLRKGATTTAVAAVAVAALSASQAPGVAPTATGGDAQSSGSTPPSGSSATGNSPYFTDLPPLNSPNKPGASPHLPVVGPAESGIPATVLAAYKQAEQALAASDPGCRIPWQLLAAIGKVESGQARGGRVDANGTTFSPILGPVLNGVGFANISDTDNGAYDGDRTHDRAVGPMQFIPSTWATWGQDANSDGRKDPNNIYDAALAAAKYLCAGGRDLSVKEDLDKAILSYNRSREYLRTVLSWFEYYKRGTHEVPDGSGVLPVDRSDSDSAGSGTTPAAPGVTPGPSPSPSNPGGSTGSPKPPSDPSKPGTGTPSPGPTTPTVPTPTVPTPTPKPTPTPPPAVTVFAIENAGDGRPTAVAGEEFAVLPKVRAKNRSGQSVVGADLVFEIVGATDARFAGNRTTAVVRTGEGGVAVAPALKAGEKTGDFTIRVTVAGRALPRLDCTATVTDRRADALVRTGDKELTAAPSSEFADAVEVKATFKGEAAAGVAVTATMVTSDEDPAENTGGPYFKGAQDERVRTLTLRTGADGLLVLPDIFSDELSGAFLLRLTTEGGATLTVELKVAAPEAPPA